MKERKKRSYPLAKTIKRMIVSAFQEDRKIFGFLGTYTVLAVVYSLLEILLPKLMLSVLTNGSKEAVKTILMIAVGYFVAFGLVGYFKNLISNTNYPRFNLIRINVMGDCFQLLNQVDYKYREDATFFEEHQQALEATSSNNNGLEGVYHKLFELPWEVLTILLFAGMIARKSPLIILGITLSLLVGVWVGNEVQKYEYSVKEERNKANRRKNYYYKTTYDFGYGKDIRIFHFQDKIMENYNKEIAAYINVIRKVKNREFLLGIAQLCALLIGDLLTYGTLILLVMHGMTIADFSMYLTATISLLALTNGLVEHISYIYNEGHYVYDLYEFMDDGFASNAGKRKKIEQDTLEIEFKNVSFCYPKTEKYIYKNLNFKINKGEKLAIVGINGAGKSTLVKLATRLFEPTEGEILVNGIPAKEFDKNEYYKMFSVVFQEINLFAFDISENVACSSKDVDEEKLMKCLDQVGLGDKVRGFDKGTKQMLLKVIDENGTQLSRGEAQKLAIARALYKNANMVILDEPTAALDALAEAEIYQDFNSLIQDKTAVYISHRLSSTKFCDKIALFNENGLAEYGTHEELMEKQGEYYKMFTVQGKYYQEGEQNEIVEEA